MGAFLGLLEGIIVFISIILIIIGLGLMISNQQWISGIITFAIGAIMMALRVLVKYKTSTK